MCTHISQTVQHQSAQYSQSYGSVVHLTQSKTRKACWPSTSPAIKQNLTVLHSHPRPAMSVLRSRLRPAVSVCAPLTPCCSLSAHSAAQTQQVLHQSIFRTPVSAHPFRDLPQAWKQHRRLLPDVADIQARQVARRRADEGRGTAPGTLERNQPAPGIF